MNITKNSRKNAARTERLQRRADAGSMAMHFPDVSSIVINMSYSQKGIAKSLPRIVHFDSGSSAFFRIGCLCKDCVDGGFDLTQLLTSMIRTHRKAAQGELSCEGDGAPADHSSIVYKIAIQYR
jgi:hypothetical protein